MSRRVFICGSSMRGQPDHHNLPDEAYAGAARTAPRYRLHAVKDGWHPGIFEVDAGDALPGVSIPGELYELDAEQYAFLVGTEPPHMYAAEVRLDDGTTATAFLYPRELIEQHGWPDISDLGGWAAYKAGAAGAPDDREQDP